MQCVQSSLRNSSFIFPQHMKSVNQWWLLEAKGMLQMKNILKIGNKSYSLYNKRSIRMYIPTCEDGAPAAAGIEILAQSQCCHKQGAYTETRYSCVTGDGQFSICKRLRTTAITHWALEYVCVGLECCWNCDLSIWHHPWFWGVLTPRR